MNAPRAWIFAWAGGAALGVVNGAAREVSYGKRTSERTAHQISTVTLIASLAGYFRMLERRWPLRDRNQALAVGSIWLMLSVSFEFTFGRLVAKTDWRELLADYNLARGRMWPLVLLWMWGGPEIARREHARLGRESLG